MTSVRFIAHRREGGDHITRRAIGQAGVNADRGVELGVCLAHHGRHRAASREARHKTREGSTSKLCDYRACDSGDDRRFANVPALITGAEPVPAGSCIVDGGLRRIRDQEAMRLGDRVHACADREIVWALRAAVQHDDEPLWSVRPIRRYIELVLAGPGSAGVRASQELRAIRDLRRNRCRGISYAGQDGCQARGSTVSQSICDVPNDLRVRREDGAAFVARPRSAASPSESFLSLVEIAFGSTKLGGSSLARRRGSAAKGVVFPVSASRRLNAAPKAGGEETPAKSGPSLDGQCPARAAWITAVASFRFCARVCSSAWVDTSIFRKAFAGSLRRSHRRPIMLDPGRAPHQSIAERFSAMAKRARLVAGRA